MSERSGSAPEETMGTFQGELRDTGQRTASQNADVARLEQAILVLQQQGREAQQAVREAKLDRSVDLSPTFSPGLRVEERLRRLEDVLDLLPPQLAERMRVLEAKPVSQGSTAPVEDLRSRFALLQQQQEDLETRWRRESLNRVHQPGVQSPRMSEIGARLSRLEDQLYSLDSVESTLETSMNPSKLGSRVRSVEEAQRQLAVGLSAVERQVLNMEGRLAGSLGLSFKSYDRDSSPEPIPLEPISRLSQPSQMEPISQEPSEKDLEFDTPPRRREVPGSVGLIVRHLRTPWTGFRGS